MIRRAALVGLIALWTAAVSAAPRAAAQPLTYKNVVAFFREVLQSAPTSVNQRCAVFYEGEWHGKNNYSHSVIVVENADEDLEVSILTTDDTGVQWLREFIDSPFFTPRETERLFALLQSTSGTQRESVGRYAVELNRWKPKHHEILVWSFTRRR